MFKALDLKQHAVKPPKKVRGLSGTSGTFPEPSEDQVQADLLAWLRIAHPAAWERTHHSPNGGARSAVTGARLKALGVRRGFPDLILPLPRRGCVGLVVELKAGRGKPTPEQLDWLDFFGANGWVAVCCTGFESAQRTFAAYLDPDTQEPVAHFLTPKRSQQ